ncbi:hypothetical protein [Thiocystis violacea]|uniref:hypothetical protein n=1 Tax=Thiocystis violacea TaxID=13725 RepID=UPI0019066648|nr:hypothetical protein [Thiocystis violacea]
MNTRSIAASLAMALLVAMPTFVQAVGNGATTSTLTQVQIKQAADKGTLEQLLAESLGENPTQEQLTALSALLEALAESDPAVAAKAAMALASAASDLAAAHPETAIALANIAQDTIGIPAVTAAAPESVGAALVALTEAVTLASRSAEAKGITLAGLQGLRDEIADLAADPLVTSATPDIGQRITESASLANAQADLAGFATAAGGDTGAGGDAGGVPSATAGDSPGGSNFTSFTSSSGGGGGTPTDTTTDASPTTL